MNRWTFVWVGWAAAVIPSNYKVFVSDTARDDSTLSQTAAAGEPAPAPSAPKKLASPAVGDTGDPGELARAVGELARAVAASNAPPKRRTDADKKAPGELTVAVAEVAAATKELAAELRHERQRKKQDTDEEKVKTGGGDSEGGDTEGGDTEGGDTEGGDTEGGEGANVECKETPKPVTADDIAICHQMVSRKGEEGRPRARWKRCRLGRPCEPSEGLVAKCRRLGLLR